MCGKEGTLYNTTVEGTSMQLCDSCKGYGEVTSKVGEENLQVHKRRTPRRYQESDEEIRTSYATIIKQAREKQRLTQEQLAHKTAIKLSQLHKYETSSQAPDIATAKKLEQTLNVSLITKRTEEDATLTRTTSGPLTIADIIKQKK